MRFCLNEASEKINKNAITPNILKHMSDNSFKALVISENDNGTYTRKVTDRSLEDLPEGEVLLRVRYSSLNYKDGLSCIGNRGVTRNYPHTPGIDASGEIDESSDSRFRPGDQVLVTGYDLGMNTSGGFGSTGR